jgi:autotransporter-associated beta strand protein
VGVPAGGFLEVQVNNVIPVVSNLVLGPLFGSGGLTKTGAGDLTLPIGGGNTYTGATVLAEGQLYLNSPPEGHAIPGPFVVGDGQGGRGVDFANPNAFGNQIADDAAITITPSGVLALAGTPEGSREVIGSLTMNGGRLTDFADSSHQATFVLNGDVTATSDADRNRAEIDVDLSLGGVTRTFTVTPGSAVGGDLVITDRLSDGGLIKQGHGGLVLNGDNTYTGPTVLNEGGLVVNGSQPNSPVAINGGIALLSGQGTIGPLTAAVGTVGPGRGPGSPFGHLTVAGDTFLGAGARLAVGLLGVNGPLQVGQLTVNGSVRLENPALTVVLAPHPALPLGTELVIVHNDGLDPVQGMFAGQPEGSFLLQGDRKAEPRYVVTYRGGDGNDVALIRLDELPSPPPPPPPPAPQGDVFERFTTALYRDVLGRAPDAGGFTIWVNALRAGQVTRIQVAQAFLRSEERLGLVVEEFYREILGRGSDAGRAHWVRGLATGQLREADVLVGFVTSAEFTARFPSNRAFVAEAYRTLLDRPLGTSEAELSFQTMRLDAGLQTRAGLAREFLRSDEAQRNAVEEYYRDYLGREADAVEVSVWTATLRTGHLDADLVQALFLASEECFSRVAG